MEAVRDVGRGKQSDALGDRRRRRGGGQKVQRRSVVIRFSTLAEPASEWNLVVKPDFFGELNQLARMLPLPEILQTIWVAQNSFRSRHAAFDVPREKPEF